MITMSEAFVTLEQRPDLVHQVRGLTREVSAEFVTRAVCRRYWRSLYNTFARFQVFSVIPLIRSSPPAIPSRCGGKGR